MKPARSRHRLHLAVYGAGSAGQQFARAVEISQEYRVVCFLDDQAALQGRQVQGVPVLAPEQLREAADRWDVAQVVIAIPSASTAQRRRIIAQVERCGLPVKTMPGLIELVEGQAAFHEIREVDVADLLGREAVAPDPSLLARCITGRSVMVAGAGGSIGSELCRQIVAQRPSALVLLDHSEIGLYGIARELSGLSHGVPVHAYLGSVTDEAHLLHLLQTHGVHTLYHAAAYKHVPLVQANVRAGVVNNVWGTLSLARAAERARVQTCVLISTDKAVRPSSLMGATKRVAELIFQAAAQGASGTVFSMVRFGNVLESSGSVVPLFRRQIQSGGPLTLTHPEVTRYFMLIPEAAQLVISAGAMAQGGEVFVLDMGEPVRIADLARAMIRLSGLTEKTAEQPEGDIEIRLIGLRPGEKLREELLIGDHVQPSGHPRIWRATERHLAPSALQAQLEDLQQALDSHSDEQVLRILQALVPEFQREG